VADISRAGQIEMRISSVAPMFYAFGATMAAFVAAVVLRHLAGGMPRH
jgi:hypothetical protein